MLSLVPFLTLLVIQPQAPDVRYSAKIVTRSWEPIPLAEVERMVEENALQPLTQSGHMKLARAQTGSAMYDGHYYLTIDGRFIEEAEKFSVYLTFGPGKHKALPSFHVSDTVSLGGLRRNKMQTKIEKLARKLGTRLAEVLGPRIEALLRKASAPAMRLEQPWDWGDIDLPNVPSGSSQIRTLLDVAQSYTKRSDALKQLEGNVFDQPAARDAVVHCIFRDPSVDLRTRCVEAIAAIARKHIPTQRVLLHVLRNDVEEKVMMALVKVSQGFVGLSKKERLQTWLELLSRDSTPSEVARKVAPLMRKEGDVPNLDITVAACLTQEAIAYGKKMTCADHLLRQIPLARRLAVVRPYLSSIGVWGTGENNVAEQVLKSIGTGLPPDFWGLFMDLATQRSTGWLRSELLTRLRKHPNPTADDIRRLCQLSKEREMIRHITATISGFVKTRPELGKTALTQLRYIRENENWLVKPSYGNPYEQLDKTIKRLEKRMAKAQ